MALVIYYDTLGGYLVTAEAGTGLATVDGYLFVELPALSGLGIPPAELIEDPVGLGVLDWHIEDVPEVEQVSIWTIDLCRDWDRIAMVTAGSLQAVSRRNARGEFTLSTTAAGVDTGWYPSPITGENGPFDPRDVNTVRLVSDGKILFAGYVQDDPGGSKGLSITSDSNGVQWTWTGVDAWWVLGRRLAYPEPVYDFAGWTVSHDVRTGVASSVLAAYLNANMGSGALVARQFPGFTVIDNVVGPNLTFSARLQTLEILAQRIARDGVIEVFPTVNFDGTLKVTLTAARDLSASVVFSDQEDLLHSEAKFMNPTGTVVIAAGEGVGALREFAYRSTGAVGADRAELLFEQSTSAELPELIAFAEAQLGLTASASYAITTETSPSFAKQWVEYGLRLGDVVAVNVGGIRYAVPIETVAFELSADQQVMRPTFGTATPDELRKLLSEVAALGNRLDSQIA